MKKPVFNVGDKAYGLVFGAIEEYTITAIVITESEIYYAVNKDFPLRAGECIPEPCLEKCRSLLLKRKIENANRDQAAYIFSLEKQLAEAEKQEAEDRG